MANRAVACRGNVPCAADQAKEDSMFFFEKKNQKTFTNLGSLYPERPRPSD
jgi:hypothetical protein